MTLIKSLNRKLILPLIRKSKLAELISGFSENGNLILNYHGVVKKYDLKLSKNHLPLHQFEEQMIYFKKNFEILSLEEIFHNNKKGSTSKNPKCLAITFDDGYLNNFSNAFPVLSSLNLPATIFVTGQSIISPTLPLWYDLLDLLNSQIEWKKLRAELQLLFVEKVDLSIYNDYSTFKNYIKTTNPQTKNKLLTLLNISKLARETFQNCDNEYWQLMKPEHLKSISTSKLIEIGSHGNTHSNLDMLNESDLKVELFEPKKMLGEVIGKEIESIAFPDGAYNEKVKSECRINYKRLLAVILKNENEKTEGDILPRLSISNSTTTDSVIVKTNLSFAKSGF